MEITQFKGLRNDLGRKFIPAEYLSDIKNFNFDSLIGLDRIKYPKVIYNGLSSDTVYGIFEYRFLDASDTLQKQSIVIIGDKIYKQFDIGVPILIASGLVKSKWSAVSYQDKLFFANGKEFPKVYNGINLYEMGAPEAIGQNTSGNLNGTYYYEMTYTTAAGEERIGTRSNSITVTNNKVLLNLPIGYTGTISRKIYRIENGGSTPKLVASIANNTDLTYLDNIADGSLTTIIIAINNRCPSPYFLEVNEDRLIGAVEDTYPTQLFITDTNLEVFDLSSATDISNQTGDNTAIRGLKVDYNILVVGSEKQIYLVDISGSSASVKNTRAYIGLKDGYTFERIPASANFNGGLMFVSNLNDIRLFSGNIAQPIATSFENLQTENWSQIIQTTFMNDIRNHSNLYAKFFDYKYHLLIDQKYYVFDIRTQAWTYYYIKTTNFLSNANVLGIYNNILYLGQKNASIIEEFYKELTYRGENVPAYFLTPQILASDKAKFIKAIYIYFKTLKSNKMKVTVNLESNYTNTINYDIDFNDGSYINEYYDPNYYETTENEEDYRVIYINKWARWLDLKIEVTEDLFYFRGYKIELEETANKETV